jgi:hypothetical protein
MRRGDRFFLLHGLRTHCEERRAREQNKRTEPELTVSVQLTLLPASKAAVTVRGLRLNGDRRSHAMNRLCLATNGLIANEL